MTPSTDSTPQARLQRHREVLAAARHATAEERRELLEAVRREARDRRRSRPLPRWLARSTSRRALALLAAVPFLSGGVSAYLPAESWSTSLVQLVGVAGVMTGLFLLRRATRELTEIPDAELDERELADRNQALGTAYLALLVVLGLVAVLAIADGHAFDTTDWKPLLLGTFGTALLLPSAVAAWRWHDLDDES